MAIQRRIKDDHMLTYLPICAGLDLETDESLLKFQA